MLATVDDEPCRGAIRKLARALEGTNAPSVGLFTRYARARDVILARRLGFLDRSRMRRETVEWLTPSTSAAAV